VTVLVDSSVWIDFLSGTSSTQTQQLEALIQQREDLCICGPILAEVLQGVTDQAEYLRIKKEFSHLIYLGNDSSTFELAASVYREMRQHGITIRKTMDCIIAAIAMQSGVHLLQSDRDFAHIGRFYPLHLF